MTTTTEEIIRRRVRGDRGRVITKIIACVVCSRSLVTKRKYIDTCTQTCHDWLVSIDERKAGKLGEAR